MKLFKNSISHPKSTHLYLFLAFIFIVSLFNITSVIAKEKPVKKKSKYVSECISLIEGRPGNHIFGAIKNTCRFPINYTYCIEDPREPVISVKDCKRELLEVEIEVKAKQTVGAEVDRGGKVYYFACRSPSEPSQLEYVRGKGIRGICTGEKDEPEASKESSSTQSNQNNQNKSNNQSSDAEERTAPISNKSDKKTQAKSCLNEDLLEKAVDLHYATDLYYKQTRFPTKDGYRQEYVERFQNLTREDLYSKEWEESLVYHKNESKSYDPTTARLSYGPARSEYIVYAIECLKSHK